MHLDTQEIHVWSTSLAVNAEREAISIKLLNPDEIERADRFRFPEHRRRFVIARAVLRQILSFYLNIDPAAIEFTYNEYNKPALVNQRIQFNLTHSEDLAAYAIAMQPVGIDIEKIQHFYEPGLPERFFSTIESQSLLNTPDDDKIAAFYRIWARKEAVIKASGKGLATSLSAFTVSAQNIQEKIPLGLETWHLQPLLLDPTFAAALASEHYVEKLQYYNFPDHKIAL